MSILLTLLLVAIPGAYIVGVDKVPVHNDKCLPTYDHQKRYTCDRVFKGTFQ